MKVAICKLINCIIMYIHHVRDIRKEHNKQKHSFTLRFPKSHCVSAIRYVYIVIIHRVCTGTAYRQRKVLILKMYKILW